MDLLPTPEQEEIVSTVRAQLDKQFELNALAADERTGFRSPAAAVRAMGTPKKGTAKVVRPTRSNQNAYDTAYREYRDLADLMLRTSLDGRSSHAQDRTEKRAAKRSTNR